MKILDTSLSNSSILDDSFSNVTGVRGISLSPETPAPTTPSVPPRFPVSPKSLYTAPSDTLAPLVPTTTITIPKPSVSTNTQPSIAPVINPSPMVYGGGGGGGAAEPTDTDSSKKTEVAEKTIFGLKPIIAYGIGITALAFVYFKFIKK